MSSIYIIIVFAVCDEYVSLDTKIANARARSEDTDTSSESTQPDERIQELLK